MLLLGQNRTTVFLLDTILERKVEKEERGEANEPGTFNAAPGSGPAVGGFPVHRISLVLGGPAPGG
jgi:hypothetical protein